MNTQTQEALKMAIELLESPHITEQGINEVVQACKEALAQPAQEPVAWMDKQTFGLCEADLAGYGEAIPLYTHPAPSWQGLSDDEIWDIANFLGKNKEWDYPVMFAKTIERTLKEKNEK